MLMCIFSLMIIFSLHLYIHICVYIFNISCYSRTHLPGFLHRNSLSFFFLSSFMSLYKHVFQPHIHFLNPYCCVNPYIPGRSSSLSALYSLFTFYFLHFFQFQSFLSYNIEYSFLLLSSFLYWHTVFYFVEFFFLIILVYVKKHIKKCFNCFIFLFDNFGLC